MSTKQNIHQLGHPLYEDYKNKNLQKGKELPSYYILENKQLDSLVSQNMVNGRLLTTHNGRWK
ncbi:polymorphic toxin type 50 domain-containing protein, partial [Staphylococcus pseudintermedius]|uniref:polymorphic toxin type 50 domain-containing protein n=1 Tax=Staphylococcus pseudintermedius TaxID=283734 RepID=UPI000E366DD9